ncbi:MAG: 3'-5' exonuclease [Verrucomicrobiota bacterium]|jgi:predicted PolB exonuclease-like 3'-5' exonuclease|nr:3'-5' exonuclease [Verrucomicrobiota bacterium]
MIKSVANEVWAFDCEWVPDLLAGRLLYHLPEDQPSAEVLRVMWEQGGATPENPQPFLRTLFCRIVSVAAVIRRTLRNGEVQLFLSTLPENPDDPAQDEPYILRRFLADGVAARAPQLVGFNSRNADLRILTQRAIVNGLSLAGLCARLDAKPWESNDIDLMDCVGGFGKAYGASLHETATLCGIPGKMDTTGNDVCGLWYSGKRRAIVEYNAFDALTTYLVWLRLAFFSGCFTQGQFVEEQRRVVRLIDDLIQKSPANAYLRVYRDAWRDLKARTGQAGDGVFTDADER